MKQLAQKLRDGTMEVLDVALPFAGPGHVLVQNHFSLISAGTEGATVSTARKSLIGKALERPAQVKQVIDSLRQQGLTQTYRAVTKRLDAYSPLGYSSAGVVIAVGDGVRGLAPGDRVACAGAGYANHAEVVAVPQNLCVKLSPEADLGQAAYNTLGAIAMQGVRQADLRVGETCVVIGLGLLGQLTCLILRASGIRVIGTDISPAAVATAAGHCADYAFGLSDPGLTETVHQATQGVNADAVIITAATDSTGPVNLAGRLLRQRGTVVVVGNVPTGFDREPDYYRKELTLRMSCSYGPGRYDLNYEEKGCDYPPGYVRWTENRNMLAFQELVHRGKIDLGYVTTHRFPIEQSPAAYDLIMARREPYLGIVIEYDPSRLHIASRIAIRGDTRVSPPGALGIGFIGAGSYAQGHLLPNVKQAKDVRLTGVATASGTSSRSVAERYGFAYTTSDPREIINDPDTGTVFIATRHDSHARYVIEALSAGKNVFVEKPLCLTRDELAKIEAAWAVHRPLLMVGFNRRFAPLAVEAKRSLRGGPMSMLFRVNAGAIPASSWIQDADLGGGRIVGEACHFIDFMTFMCGAPPVRVYASAMEDPSRLEDTVAINLDFANGSIGSICYFANGSKELRKEYVEIYKGGMVARIDDFKDLEILSNGRPSRRKLASQDKGQANMLAATLLAVSSGLRQPPISFGEIRAVTLATFGVVRSIRDRLPRSVDETRETIESVIDLASP